MHKVQKKSPVPIYIAAGVYALYALLFPLYTLWHFLIAAVVTAAAWLIADRLITPKEEYVPDPEPEPVSYGERADAILAEAKRADGEMLRLRDSIADETVKSKIDALRVLGNRIAEQAKAENPDLARIERFQSYYPPTTLRLLNAYDRMAAQQIEGENITAAKEKIAAMLDTETEAYTKQLDSLFRREALDIDADIQVMNRMLEREGLAGESELDTLVQQAAEREKAERAAAEQQRKAAEAENAAREAAAEAAKLEKQAQYQAAEQAMLGFARSDNTQTETKSQEI